MRYLQEKDPILSRVKTLLLSGQAPGNKENISVRRYFKSTFDITVAADGCIITKRKNKNKFVERELIVVPEGISTGLVYSLHLNLNHPSPTQLSRIIQTRFFFLNRDKLVQAVGDQCVLCQAVKHIPKEIHEFEPNVIPEHPGKTFTIDVIKHAKKNILVAVENFSGFISTCFITSEKSKDLVEGIIKTIFPIKSAISSVRVDQAPGFRKLMKEKVSMTELGIDLIPGDAKNKNALAIVDKKINELEKEIKKIACFNNVRTVKILAMAAKIVNEKIKNQGMSAKEILFSRDQITSENIHLCDEEIANVTMEKRKENNPYSSLSKSVTNKPATLAGAKKGNLVFLKQDGSKFKKRDLYLVTDTDELKNTVTICKIINALSNEPAYFQPQNYLYNVKQSDIYMAPCQPTVIHPEHIFLDPPAECWIPDQQYLNTGDNIYFPTCNKTEIEDYQSDVWVFEEIVDNDVTASETIESHEPTEVEITGENLDSDENLIEQTSDDLFNSCLPNPIFVPSVPRRNRIFGC